MILTLLLTLLRDVSCSKKDRDYSGVGDRDQEMQKEGGKC